MRPARMILAALAIAALAACGTNPTAPDATIAPDQPRLDGSTTTDPLTCTGTIVTTLTATGVVTQCVVAEGQYGSGVGN